MERKRPRDDSDEDVFCERAYDLYRPLRVRCRPIRCEIRKPDADIGTVSDVFHIAAPYFSVPDYVHFASTCRALYWRHSVVEKREVADEITKKFWRGVAKGFRREVVPLVAGLEGGYAYVVVDRLLERAEYREVPVGYRREFLFDVFLAEPRPTLSPFQHLVLLTTAVALFEWDGVARAFATDGQNGEMCRAATTLVTATANARIKTLLAKRRRSNHDHELHALNWKICDLIFAMTKKGFGKESV